MKRPWTPNDGAGEQMSAADFLTQVQKSAKPDWVARAPTWRKKAKRWIIRAIWRMTWKLLRKAGARRGALAPFMIAHASWLASAIISLYERGWLTLLLAGAVGAIPLYWWLGGPLAFLTRAKEKLRSTRQRWWYATAYAVLLTLSTFTAAGNLGPPMPGFWWMSMLLWWVPWMSFRRIRKEETKAVERDQRHVDWEKIPQVKGAPLGEITDLGDKWTATVDLTEVDMLVSGLASTNVTAFIAKRYLVPTSNVLVDTVTPGINNLARLTVVEKSVMDNPIDIDEKFFEQTEPGCVNFHQYSDGHLAQLRAWTPGSGTVNTIMSGDVGSGKSGGIFTYALSTLWTGRFHLLLADAQEGQSQPALKNIVDKPALTPEDIYYQLHKLEAGMMARSRYLGEYRWRDEWGELNEGVGFFDQDVFANQRVNRETGEHPLHWPMIFYILEEAPKAFDDDEWGPLIVAKLESCAKLSRKTGIGLLIAPQYPGLEQIGNSAVIRQNFRTGNVVAYRNSESVSKGMLLTSEFPSPTDIPKETPEGKQTQGFCIVSSAAPRSSRTAYARSAFTKRQTMWAKAARQRMPDLDEFTAEAMAKADIKAQEAAEAARMKALIEGGATKPATSATTTGPAVPQKNDQKVEKQASVVERITAYFLAQRDADPNWYGEASTGVIAQAIGAPMSTVNTTMNRNAELFHQPRRGMWRIGPKPDEADPHPDAELVTSAA